MTETIPTTGNFNRYLGNKRYELTNYLGNVMAVLSDRRFMFHDETSGNALYCEPDVLAAQDYDPFGMILVGRSWQAGSTYQCGFNGKELVHNNKIVNPTPILNQAFAKVASGLE